MSNLYEFNTWDKWRTFQENMKLLGWVVEQIEARSQHSTHWAHGRGNVAPMSACSHSVFLLQIECAAAAQYFNWKKKKNYWKSKSISKVPEGITSHLLLLLTCMTWMIRDEVRGQQWVSSIMFIRARGAYCCISNILPVTQHVLQWCLKVCEPCRMF